MSRAEHPAQRHHDARIDVTLEAWWRSEQAAADRDEAAATFYRTASWCLVAFTAVVVGSFLLIAATT